MDEICNTESGQVRSGQVSELSHLHLEDRPVPVTDGGAAAAGRVLLSRLLGVLVHLPEELLHAKVLGLLELEHLAQHDVEGGHVVPEYHVEL